MNPILEWSGHTLDDGPIVTLSIQFAEDTFVRHVYDEMIIDDHRTYVSVSYACLAIELFCQCIN